MSEQVATNERTQRHLIVCANPSPRSFSHAIVNAYADEVRRQGHDVDVRDLYAIDFDPVLRENELPRAGDWAPTPDVAEELSHLTPADVLVLVYPIWVGAPPAIMKGYIDRVLGANFHFEGLEDGAAQPALAGKPLLSITTSGMPLSWLRDQGQTSALRDIFDVYLWRGFGMRQSRHIMLDQVVRDMNPVYADQQIARVRDAARQAVADLAGQQSSLFDGS